jgi:hypothetical protein
MHASVEQLSSSLAQLALQPGVDSDQSSEMDARRQSGDSAGPSTQLAGMDDVLEALREVRWVGVAARRARGLAWRRHF